MKLVTNMLAYKIISFFYNTSFNATTLLRVSVTKQSKKDNKKHKLKTKFGFFTTLFYTYCPVITLSVILHLLSSYSTLVTLITLYIFQCSDNTQVNFQNHHWMHASRMRCNVCRLVKLQLVSVFQKGNNTTLI